MRSIEDIFREVESVPDFYGHIIDSADYRNGYGDSPLHVVCCWGDCEAISLLLKGGANINAKGESGFSPLHCSVEQNHPDAVKLLLENGALIQVDDSGVTPFELAGFLGCNEILQLFSTSFIF